MKRLPSHSTTVNFLTISNFKKANLRTLELATTFPPLNLMS
jgi:hypothetical protein